MISEWMLDIWWAESERAVVSFWILISRLSPWPIFFLWAKATIKEESKPSLDKLAEVLAKKPEWGLQIAGHTDSDGSSRANLLLSKRRSEAVRDYLMKKASITDQTRFKVLYFGESQPLVPNTSPENKQKNRRVEMTIIFK